MRHVLPLSVLSLLTIACTSTPALPGEAPSFDAPAPKHTVDPACDTTRAPIDDACVLDESLGVFASANAAPFGDGTRIQPYTSAAQALRRARADGKKRVYLCEGLYEDALELADGISIFGGLSCAAGVWKGGGKRARVSTRDGSPVTARDIKSPTRIDAIEIVARDATLPSYSSIGIILREVPGLVFSRVLVRAGAGAAGRDGAIAVQLANGPDANGVAGQAPAVCTGGCSANPSQNYPDPRVSRGGVNTCVGAAGFTGQTGAAGGGSGGFRVAGGGGGIFGAQYSYALGVDATTSGPPPFGFEPWGSPGTDGGPATRGLMRYDGFYPGSGQDGGRGTAGAGGAGGNGVGLLAQTVPPEQEFAGQKVWGWSGGGGGAGGCPGLGGHGGVGGGASIGVISAWAPPAFIDSEIVSAAGGRGGKGSFGSKPTAGGTGGAGSGPVGTAGAAGGWGGRGGYGSHGDGGPSAAIVVDGPAPKLTGTTLVAGPGGDGQPEAKDAGQVIPASASGSSEKIWQL